MSACLQSERQECQQYTGQRIGKGPSLLGVEERGEVDFGVARAFLSAAVVDSRRSSLAKRKNVLCLHTNLKSASTTLRDT